MSVSTPLSYQFEFPQRDCVILPLEVQGEVGVYSEAELTLKKDLTEAGIDADYLHDPQHRRWLGLHGPVVDNPPPAPPTPFGPASHTTRPTSLLPTSLSGHRSASLGSAHW